MTLTPVFLPDDEIDPAVAVPVARQRIHHAQVNREAAVAGHGGLRRAETRVGPRAHVFEIGELVAELAAEEVEIAVVVPVRDGRARVAVDVNRGIVGFEADAFGIDGAGVRAGVPVKPEVAVERAARPVAGLVERPVPAVFLPVAGGPDEVEEAVAVPVHLARKKRPNASFGFLERAVVPGPARGVAHAFPPLFAAEKVFLAIAVHVGQRAVPHPVGEPLDLPENVLGFLDVEVDAALGLVLATVEEIPVAVIVPVDGHGGRPEADAEVGRDAVAAVGQHVARPDKHGHRGGGRLRFDGIGGRARPVVRADPVDIALIELLLHLGGEFLTGACVEHAGHDAGAKFRDIELRGRLVPRARERGRLHLNRGARHKNQ